MMRRPSAIALAAALLGGLFAIPAAPAGAQNGGTMLDAPRLGFEIDPKAGHVGDTVGAQVDPVDVEEHCITEYGQLQALFGDAAHPDFVPGEVSRTPGPVFADYMNLGPMVGIEPPADGVWPVQDNFPHIPQIPPTPPLVPNPAWVDPQYWAWSITGRSNLVPAEPWLIDTPERYAAMSLYFLLGLLGTPGTGGGIPGEAQTEMLEAINILTFVDPVTQELVGEMGGFDPDTGVGQVDVPDLDPGLWAVAAACVEPVITEESFMAAIAAGAEAVLAEGFELPTLASHASINAETVAVPMLAELMAPRALGLDFYCILNEDGFCATPPDPVGLLAELSDEELAEFADLEAGAEGAGTGSDVDAELLTEAVTAAPSFTG